MSATKLKHVGIHIHRLADPMNMPEIVYADKWRKENSPSICMGTRGILDYILSSAKSVSEHRFDDVSERDETVAATVIQWLGSPVGQCFISECKADIEKGRGK